MVETGLIRFMNFTPPALPLARFKQKRWLSPARKRLAKPFGDGNKEMGGVG
jgi:hypothetical protein